MNLGELTRKLQSLLAMHGEDIPVLIAVWRGRNVASAELLEVDDSFDIGDSITLRGGVPHVRTAQGGKL